MTKKDKEENVERTTMKKELEKVIPIIDILSLDKKKVYIIQLSEEWLDRMGGNIGHLRKQAGKKIGRTILSYLSGNDIEAIVLIGEAIHIYDTEKKSLEEVLKDVRDRRYTGEKDSRCREESQEGKDKRDGDRWDGDEGSRSEDGEEEEGVQSNICP